MPKVFTKSLPMGRRAGAGDRFDAAAIDGADENEHFVVPSAHFDIALDARGHLYDAKGKLPAMVGAEDFPGNAAGMDLAIDSLNRIALVEPVSRKIRFDTVAQAQARALGEHL